MKTFLLFAAFFLSLPAVADTAGTGLGITLGSPSGITGRTWIDGVNSFDYGAGWGIIDSNKFEVYGDYLWNRADAFELNEAKFDFFFGGGISLRTSSGQNDNEAVFGPRIPVGFSHTFSNPNLELFAVAALNVGIIPHSDVYFDLHVGARFYLF
jgi:hypothetical protein